MDIEQETDANGSVTRVVLDLGARKYAITPTFDGGAVMCEITAGAATKTTSQTRYELRASICEGLDVVEYYEDKTAADNRKIAITAAAFGAIVDIEKKIVQVDSYGNVVVV